jgi:hypothetical protein
MVVRLLCGSSCTLRYTGGLPLRFTLRCHFEAGAATPIGTFELSRSALGLTHSSFILVTGMCRFLVARSHTTSSPLPNAGKHQVATRFSEWAFRHLLHFRSLLFSGLIFSGGASLDGRSTPAALFHD